MRTTRRSTTSLLAAVLMAGTAATALAQDRPTDPVAFSGHIASGASMPLEGADAAWVFRRVEMSDPRLEGTITHSHNLDFADGFRFFSSVWRIENADGAWEGSEHTVIMPGEDRTTSSVVLVGEGSYDGLTALAEFTFVGYSKDVRGVIIHGDLPPIPPPAHVAE